MHFRTIYERLLSIYGLIIAIAIVAELKLPLRTVHNIIERFINTDGNLEPSQPKNVHSARTDDATEIQRGPEENEVCLPENISSASSTSRVYRTHLFVPIYNQLSIN